MNPIVDRSSSIRQIGSKTGEPWGLIGIAEVHILRGELEKALPILKEIEKITKNVEEKLTVAYVNYLWGKFYAAEGNKERAMESLRLSIKIYEDIGMRDNHYHKTLYEFGKISGIRELLYRALEFFERIGNQFWVKRIREEMDLI